ncbi:hypothetical protein Tco_0065493 [Tanacetum coccineum]
MMDGQLFWKLNTEYDFSFGEDGGGGGMMVVVKVSRNGLTKIGGVGDGSIKYWTSSGVIGEKGWSVMSIDCIFLMLEVVEKSFRGGDVGGVQVKLGESDVDEVGDLGNE